MSDEIKSPFWWCFISVRLANALNSEFMKGRNKQSYYGRVHDHIDIDFDSHTDETIRPVFKKLLEDKIIFPKRIRGLGKKGIVEFYKWCGYQLDKKDGE